MPAKLTRQHFQFFADCIKASLDSTADDLFSDADKAVIKRVAGLTAVHMSSTNPAFDRKRFLDACGV